MSTTTVPAATTHGAEAGAATTSGAWRDFVAGPWCDAIDVRDFIQRNYTEYTGDSSFLAGATERTTGIWAKLTAMFPEERAKGIYDVDTHIPGTITSHAAGYIDQANELIVGLQTDAPLKRAMIPNGGWRMVETSLKTYGYEPDQQVKKIFTQYRKTHNQGVFDAYPPNVRAARSSHIITGLPDAYGRGRIIGDYRRVALYGIDALIDRVIFAKSREELVAATKALDRVLLAHNYVVPQWTYRLQRTARWKVSCSRPLAASRTGGPPRSGMFSQ